ncbi:restriction endonuclease subunit S [Mycoplasmopsis agassizii]|uniref:restriction endonuclease subunit S n=1 Tax=Mycoplasmopsis agassizii TaxID=33922 RepID=UPI0035270F09
MIKMTPENLKKSILQYALNGKLTTSKTEDESIEVILDKIKKQKENLYNDGKIKKQTLNENILNVDDENIFPKKWLLSTLNKISFLYTGNSINKNTKEQKFTNVDGVDYISTKDVSIEQKINYDNGIKIPNELKNDFRLAHKDSILLCIEGGSAGKKIAITSKDIFFGNKLCCINSYVGINKFLFYYLQSPQFLKYFHKNKTGIIGGVSIKKLGDIPFPIISVDEQNRIIKKLQLLEKKISEYNEYYYKLQELDNNLTKNIGKSILQKIMIDDFKLIETNNSKQNFKWVKLGDVAIINAGDKITTDQMSNDYEYPAMGGGYKPTGYYNDWNYESIISIAKDGIYAGFVNWMEEKFWATNGSFALWSKTDDVLTKYLFYVLKSMQDEIRSMKIGSAITHLYKKPLSNLIIPIPPLEIQKKLIEKLDKILPRLDELNYIIKNQKTGIWFK